MELPRPIMLISEDGASMPSTGEGTAVPGSVFAVDDPFYWATSDDPESFEHDDKQLGTLHATAIVGDRGGATWNIVFEFIDGSRITGTAWLPVTKARPGAGRGTVTGGSEDYRDLVGDLEVNARNPNRWTAR